MLSRLSAALLARHFFAPPYLLPRAIGSPRQPRSAAEGLAHKGEVLWKRGRTDEAQAAFKQGLDIWPKSDALKATLARLAVTLPTPTAQ